MYELFIPSYRHCKSLDIVEWRVSHITKPYDGTMWPKKEILQWLQANVKNGEWAVAIGRPDKNSDTGHSITGIYLYFENKEDLIYFKLSYIEKEERI